MLVLTRKLDEQILIGDNVKITVIKVRNNQVRLGISAPRDVRVLRGELEPKETEMIIDLDLEDDQDADASQALLQTTAEMEASYRPEKARKPATKTRATEASNRVSKMLPTSNEPSRIVDTTETTGTVSSDGSAPSLSLFSGKVNRRTGEGSLKRSPLAGYFTAP